MPDVVDFYQYKYSRSNYYINLVFEKEKIKNIKKSIEDGFDDLFINKEYEYAYESDGRYAVQCRETIATCRKFRSGYEWRENG